MFLLVDCCGWVVIHCSACVKKVLRDGLTGKGESVVSVARTRTRCKASLHGSGISYLPWLM